MASEISRISPVLVELKIEVPWSEVQKEIDTGFQKLGKTANLKGFRPGKVPRTVLQQMFGAEVRKEAVSEAVSRGLMSAVREHNILPLAAPSVDPEEIKEGSPVRFTAKVEIRPQIDKVDSDGLAIVRKTETITPKDVDAEVERLRERVAAVRAPIAPRPARDGDVLTLDYEAIVDGATRADLGAKDRTVPLGAGVLLDDFEAGVRGMNENESKSVSVTFPNDHGATDLAGKTVEFKVLVKKIDERILPEADDAFAKQVGPFATLLELRSKIREELENGAKRRAEMSLRDQVLDKLVDKNPIPVPPTLVAEEAKSIRRELRELVRGAALPEEIESKVGERAERQIRAGILLSEIAREKKIDVADAEVEAFLAARAKATGRHVAKLKAELGAEGRDQLRSQMLRDKILEVLLAGATISDAPADSKDV